MLINRRIPAQRVGWLMAVAGLTTAVIIEALDQSPLQDHLLIAAEHGLRHENPVAVLPASRSGEWVLVIILAVVVTASVSALVWRYRRSHGDERQQLKWFAYGSAPLVGAVVLIFRCRDPLRTTLILVFWTVPAVAMAIALLRYRLYDIDRIIDRTLAYALVTALLVGTGTALVLLLGVVLRPIAADSELVEAASVLAVAAVFDPVPRRIQTAVDRPFDCAHYDAQRTLVRRAAAAGGEPRHAHRLTRTVRATMRPARVSVWLREGEMQP